MTRSVPALLLTLVYAAALVLAVSDPGGHVLAGLLVLGGLTARGAARHRRAAAPGTAVRSTSPRPLGYASPSRDVASLTA